MALKGLNFTSLPPSGRNPADALRQKTIARLEEQKLLLANPSYVRTSKRWVKINGEKSLVEKRHRVFPWWRSGPNGGFVFVNRHPTLTPHRRPILPPLGDGFWR